MKKGIEYLEDLREPDHYGRVPESLIYDKLAPHSSIRLYATLDRHLNKKTKACYPGYRRIQELTGMGKPTISKGLKYLQKGRYINIIRTPQRSNRYQLMDIKVVTKLNYPLPVQELNPEVVTKPNPNQRIFNQQILTKEENTRLKKTGQIGDILNDFLNPTSKSKSF